jgi:hypothetical protein
MTDSPARSVMAICTASCRDENAKSSQVLKGIRNSNVKTQYELAFKLSLFWEVTQCGLAGHTRVESACCVHQH